MLRCAHLLAWNILIVYRIKEAPSKKLGIIYKHMENYNGLKIVVVISVNILQHVRNVQKDFTLRRVVISMGHLGCVMLRDIYIMRYRKIRKVEMKGRMMKL